MWSVVRFADPADVTVVDSSETETHVSGPGVLPAAAVKEEAVESGKSFHKVLLRLVH